ncbi:hypothetical protein J6590_048654 [Homalodisca vitripennis]|nr:hypothetical protein J6590_048654 [Homalodisca vitripennis]
MKSCTVLETQTTLKTLNTSRSEEGSLTNRCHDISDIRAEVINFLDLCHHLATPNS